MPRQRRQPLDLFAPPDPPDGPVDDPLDLAAPVAAMQECLIAGLLGRGREDRRGMLARRAPRQESGDCQ